jgi:hypothetical protein
LSNRPYVLISFVFFFSVTSLFGGGEKEAPQQMRPAAAPEITTTATDAAVLESGPVKRYGILVLPANAISHHEGVYADGAMKLTVRYAEEDIIIPGDWVTGLCGTAAIRFTQESGRLHYVYSAEEGWFVLFDVPEDYGKTCAFIERFLQRLRYFKSVTKSEAAVPFPAIVEVPEGSL